MFMSENNTLKQIDLEAIAKTLWRRRRKFYVPLSVAFVASCALILCVPRYYRCEITLAPELSNTSNLGSLGSLASSFGLDMSGSIPTEDAIFPELYPDLMSSTSFKTSLFPIKVSTLKGEVKDMTYYEYLKTKQKQAWWNAAKGWAMTAIKRLFDSEKPTDFNGNGGVNAFHLTREQDGIGKMIDGKIGCKVDKKTGVISITVEDQDPLVCATIADSTRVMLQEFITDYRTNKARRDLDYTEELYAKAKDDYEQSRQRYVAYSDANNDVVLESYKSEKSKLESEMQLNYNVYSTLATQLQAAKAKVLERTPAFTTLKCASVPLKPAGPKRVIFVAMMTILTFCGVSVYILVSEKRRKC